MRIDCHVHMVGNGTNGSGSWLRLGSLYRQTLARLMLREVGLPQEALHGDLEEAYFSLLNRWVRESSLDAIVLLAQEQVYDDSGRLIPGKGTMHITNGEVLKRCRESSCFLPGVSIHPGRLDAMEELERCMDQGAFLMKCLPNCQNINCSDRRYLPFWQKMADRKLPLLVHTGGELSLEVTASRYANPEYLALPLECGVTVIAAHAGTSAHYFDFNYIPVIRRMLERFPNLYVDNSGLNTPIRSRHFQTYLEEPFLSRVIHGSDVPIPISALWVRLRRLITGSDKRHADSAGNPLEKDIRIKKAMGFPEESFTRLSVLTGKA